jgi:hypothetical protein
MEKPFEIAVAWRIYPGVSKSPIIHPANKLKLVQTSLLSFIQSAGRLKISYYFILDGCPPEYSLLIRKLFGSEKFSIIETSSIGNLKTFEKQVEILTTQTDADVVYFAEDDYLYRPGLFHKLYEVILNKEADFASCYAAKDIFTHPIHAHKRNVMFARNYFWIEANSTCLTFITLKSTLEKTKKLFLTYSKGNNDCALWLVLTKKHILNPFAWLRFLGNKECMGILKVAVKRSFIYFFTVRKYSLWIPLPAIGTHLEMGLESPGIDWVKLAGEIENTADKSG